MKTKTLNQKKKELFELLVEYYSLKPEEYWCKRMLTIKSPCGDKHCAVGFLMADFDAVEIRDTVCRLLDYQLMSVNDGNHYYMHIPTPKGRVIAYLENEIKKL